MDSQSSNAGTVKITLSREYLDELKSKVEHGFNLLNEEARHLFAHAGILIPKHQRCQRCNAEGSVTNYDNRTKSTCDLCGGKGYDPPRTKSTSDTQTLQWKLKTDGRWMAMSKVKNPLFTNWWIVSVTDDGLFDISASDFNVKNVDCFKTLKEAQGYCQDREDLLSDRAEAANDY